MFFKKNLAWQDMTIKILFGLSLFFNALAWYISLRTGLSLARNLQFLSLHYTVYSGVDWVGNWLYLFLYPLLGTAIIGYNFWLGSRVYSRDRLLSYFLAATALIAQIILTVFIIFLLSINIQAR